MATSGSGNKKEDTKGLTAGKSEDFSEWYSELVQKSGLAEYAPIAGCMIIKPLGYDLWEAIRSWFDSRIREKGHRNLYFPLFIPEKLLKKEADHFEGFTPEVAWVVDESGKEGERFALRPTSETIFYESFSKWIRSWRDLPLLLNQWCNIVRWETKATRLFLRTREFLWQEGHTAHATEAEAETEARMILDMYRELMETQLAVPVITGRKSEKERFAGAVNTYTLEALMPDGRALQMGTTHNLGQNFSKPFGITYRDKDEQERHVWQTSWGISTRLIGSVVMTHGDDRGLVLPPNIAPVQAVVIPIIFEDSKKEVTRFACQVAKKLKSRFRIAEDLREEYSAGWKFNEWEMKGTPLRIEVGPRDMKSGKAVLVRRDNGSKRQVKLAEMAAEVGKELASIQDDLLSKARKFLKKSIRPVASLKELASSIRERKMVRMEWCGSPECEDLIKEKTSATIRLIAEDEKPMDKCAVCGGKAGHVVYVAKQY